MDGTILSFLGWKKWLMHDSTVRIRLKHILPIKKVINVIFMKMGLNLLKPRFEM